MLTGLHFLLTYMCNSECDHCFVFSSPRAKGTFTLAQLQSLLEEAEAIGTIEWIYLEGGEPFLFYPVMLESARMARARGFRVGIVTNSYFATDDHDTELWLKPFTEIGIDDFRVSNDPYHYTDETDNPAIRAREVARRLSLPAAEIHIDEPSVVTETEEGQKKGEPVIGGTTRFRGRAAEKLTADLPRRPWAEFTECPYEDLAGPERVHLDSYGNVHLCQGLSLGNVWEIPLSTLVRQYNAASHPVCGPLVEGGPSRLAEKYDVRHEDSYVDACHFCYYIRKELQETFPGYLAPPQVYGREE